MKERRSDDVSGASRCGLRCLRACVAAGTMNAELLDPFAQDYPEGFTASYNFGHATCLRFNRSGSHVAIGLVDGLVLIWDTATSGIARALKAHTRTVQSLRHPRPALCSRTNSPQLVRRWPLSSLCCPRLEVCCVGPQGREPPAHRYPRRTHLECRF